MSNTIKLSELRPGALVCLTGRSHYSHLYHMKNANRLYASHPVKLPTVFTIISITNDVDQRAGRLIEDTVLVLLPDGSLGWTRRAYFSTPYCPGLIINRISAP